MSAQKSGRPRGRLRKKLRPDEPGDERDQRGEHGEADRDTADFPPQRGLRQGRAPARARPGDERAEPEGQEENAGAVDRQDRKRTADENDRAFEGKAKPQKPGAERPGFCCGAVEAHGAHFVRRLCVCKPWGMGRRPLGPGARRVPSRKDVEGRVLKQHDGFAVADEATSGCRAGLRRYYFEHADILAFLGISSARADPVGRVHRAPRKR